MTDLVLLDDTVARGFEPFALTRPVCELRAGGVLLRERWERALGMPAVGIVTAPHLREFDEPWSVGAIESRLKAGTILANSRCAVTLARAGTGSAWVCAGRIAAVRLARDVEAGELAGGALTLDALAGEGSGPRVEIQGRWLGEVWDVIRHLAPMLAEDVAGMSAGAQQLGAPDALIGGEHGVFVEDGAIVEPLVYFDASAGPILIRRGAQIQAFTRIVGPCIVGVEAIVGGDKIATCSIGEVCKVHGEVSNAVFLGHCNKGHDGFLGHSYLGRWVNLGAGTITSNLKNTYGTVHLWTPSGERDTGLQFLGTLFGDHAKTGIGTSLNTGTVIGAGANVYGSVMPPKMVPPFAWGDRAPYSTYRMDKFLEVASRMMQRRHVELSERQARQLSAAAARARELTA